MLAGKERFQQGSARVAILSAAASTGCSLHDINGARRCMIALELPYSPVQFVQTAGRCHRAGQRSAPKIVIVSCPEIEAESRFSASISARLAQLGAISVGDRRSGAGVVDFAGVKELTGSRANTAAAKAAHKHAINLGSAPNSIRFMNRALAAGMGKGNEVMASFKEELAKLESEARRAGKTDRVTEFQVDGTVIREVDSFERKLPEGVSGISLAKRFQVDTGVSFEDAVAKRDAHMEPSAGFVVIDRPLASWISTIGLATFDKSSSNSKTPVTILRPSGAKSRLTYEAFSRSYKKIDDEDASLQWRNWYEKAKLNGSRMRQFGFLSIPLVDWLATNYVWEARLTRIVYTDGPSMIGIRFPVEELRRVEKNGEL